MMQTMQLYLQLLGQLRQLWPERQLTLAERGCLAMAAQAAAADGSAIARIERAVQRGNTAFVCQQLLKLAHDDFTERVCARELASPLDIQLVETTLLVKNQQARAGQLTDFLLTGQYRFFPDFFRWYDTITHIE